MNVTMSCNMITMNVAVIAVMETITVAVDLSARALKLRLQVRGETVAVDFFSESTEAKALSAWRNNKGAGIHACTL